MDHQIGTLILGSLSRLDAAGYRTCAVTNTRAARAKIEGVFAGHAQTREKFLLIFESASIMPSTDGTQNP